MFSASSPDRRRARAFRQLGLEPVELMPAYGPVAIRRYLTHRDLSILGQGTEINDPAPATLVDLTIR